jgi:uncharacterized protein
VNTFSVNIVGLSLTNHDLHFDLDSGFFKQYGNNLVEEGQLKADVSLTKHETFVECNFKIQGTVKAVCDRSLDPFELPLHIDQKLVYKYGDEDKEISEDVVMINRDTATLDLGQPMYEFITLAIPIKKLHPRFKEEDDLLEEGKLVYTSASSSENDDTTGATDPRWDALKKLT